MSKNAEFDIVVYGATGYTGQLVAEYMNEQYGADGEISWALAGRSLSKLEAVRSQLAGAATLPLVVVDASQPESLKSLAASARVIITTVGPYQLYGSELVAACAEAGTDYVDLCGEPAWMKQMIDENSAKAKASGARIVFSCGFDSIPFDLGVFFLQQVAKETTGSVITRVHGRVRSMQGSWSGGTLASFKATMAAAAQDPELIKTLLNPYALAEGFLGVEQPGGLEPCFDPLLDSWLAPFVMATINTKNIHRSNLLLGHQYGQDFSYDEMLITGPGEEGEAMADAVASDKSMAKDQTQPGEGPSKEQRESGFYDIVFMGEAADGQTLCVSVKGDMDPGYGSTSKMIVESAVGLLKNPDSASGGVLTPAPALGSLLIERLQNHAGLSFAQEQLADVKASIKA